MPLPIVAIVGRPNVGKSSLLNALVGRRVSIVDAVAGVTRDRISAVVPAGAGYVELVDTGGFGVEDPDNLTAQIVAQIGYAIDAAALVLFVVDAREGPTALDRQVAALLRKQDKPVVLVANKVDNPAQPHALGELNALGFGEPMQVSALEKLGREDLLDVIDRHLQPAPHEPAEPVMKLAIVGRRNVGKSTFVNALAGAQRVIVSEIPGTTRDSVDVSVNLDGRPFVVIDTAGVRRRTKLADDIEFYSRHRALRSIRRADVVLLMLDATEPVGRVDDQLVDYIVELHKPTVVVINKWDTVPGHVRPEEYGPYLAKALPDLSFAPIVFTTAQQAQGVREAVAQAETLFGQANTRVGTAQVNEVVEAILAEHHPRATKTGSHGKVFYASQIGTAPPTIVLFVNDLGSFDASYQRHLLRGLRQRLPFAQVPIRLVLRPRRRRGKEPKAPAGA